MCQSSATLRGEATAIGYLHAPLFLSAAKLGLACYNVLKHMLQFCYSPLRAAMGHAAGGAETSG